MTPSDGRWLDSYGCTFLAYECIQTNNVLYKPQPYNLNMAPGDERTHICSKEVIMERNKQTTHAFTLETTIHLRTT